MSILKSIPEDSTYTASEQVKSLVSLTKGDFSYCFDLKEFTNMLPLSLQKEVLGVLSQDPNFVEAWTKIVGYPIDHNGKEIKFMRGQPMGILSS